MNCEQFHPLLTPYLLGDLGPEDAAAVRAHLEACAACRTERAALEPALALLTEALAAPAVAPRRLSPSHRSRILYPSRARRSIDWIGEHHPQFAVAAGLAFIFGSLWLMLVPAKLSSVRGVSVTLCEPEAMEALDEIGEVALSGSVEAPEPVDFEFAPGAMLPPMKPTASPPPAPPPAVTAPAPDLGVQPAEFDSVAIVKSPVIMKGIYGNRSLGARGAALQRFGGSGGDDATAKPASGRLATRRVAPTGVAPTLRVEGRGQAERGKFETGADVFFRSELDDGRDVNGLSRDAAAPASSSETMALTMAQPSTPSIREERLGVEGTRGDLSASSAPAAAGGKLDEAVVEGLTVVDYEVLKKHQNFPSLEGPGVGSSGDVDGELVFSSLDADASEKARNARESDDYAGLESTEMEVSKLGGRGDLVAVDSR